MEKQKDESEARYELQLTALNENLTTIRADMNTHQTRLLEVEKSNDELRGEKLGQCLIFFHYLLMQVRTHGPTLYP